jgi:hypothetical protein
MRQLKITKSITNRESAALDKYLEELEREQRMYSLFEQHLNLEQIKSVTPEDIFPSNETEYACINKLGLYLAENCIPFVTDKKMPYYLLDNLAVLDEPLRLKYQDKIVEFNQVEQLFLTPRMQNPEAHFWLMNNLFKGRGNAKGRVDGRIKSLYKRKKEHIQRQDWEAIQVEWMKAVLSIKYQQCHPFRELLHSTGNSFLIEDATQTNYASNCYWGAKQISHEGAAYFIGVNAMGKILMQLRENNGLLTYSLPDDLHLFGVKFSEYVSLRS